MAPKPGTPEFGMQAAARRGKIGKDDLAKPLAKAKPLSTDEQIIRDKQAFKNKIPELR